MNLLSLPYGLKLLEENVLQVDKPLGITSSEVVRLIKFITKAKIGHAGTLDPMATGSLIVLFDKATKRMEHFLHKPKQYKAIVACGVSNETLDLEQPLEIVSDVNVPLLEVEPVLAKYMEAIKKGYLQQVPQSSAIKLGGIPLYERSRKNEQIIPPSREVIIHDITFNYTSISNSEFIAILGRVAATLRNNLGEHSAKWKSYGGEHRGEQLQIFERVIKNLEVSRETVETSGRDSFNLIEFTAVVSKGTYVRTLAKDIASALGTKGVLLSLRREVL